MSTIVLHGLFAFVVLVGSEIDSQMEIKLGEKKRGVNARASTKKKKKKNLKYENVPSLHAHPHSQQEEKVEYLPYTHIVQLGPE